MIINEEFYYHPLQMPTANQKHPTSSIIYKHTHCPLLPHPLTAELPLVWLLQANTRSHIRFLPTPPSISCNQLSISGSTREVQCFPVFFSQYVAASSQKHVFFSKPLKHPPDSIPISISSWCQWCFSRKCIPVTPYLISSLGFVPTWSLTLDFLWGSANSSGPNKSRLILSGSYSGQCVVSIHVIPCHDVFCAQHHLQISCP